MFSEKHEGSTAVADNEILQAVPQLEDRRALLFLGLDCGRCSDL